MKKYHPKFILRTVNGILQLAPLSCSHALRQNPSKSHLRQDFQSSGPKCDTSPDLLQLSSGLININLDAIFQVEVLEGYSQREPSDATSSVEPMENMPSARYHRV